jgi:hypothetical protein
MIWHGFVSPKEFSRNITTFLLFLMVSLPQLLQEKFPDFSHRPLRNLMAEKSEKNFDFGMGTHALKGFIIIYLAIHY